ncbi:CHAT domain-containing protein [Fulvivirgaceae bacterium PWU4]|uniref:CHAT domain-containing protein n=1 Tax=Chryseosolibacter histidini TaxID=2782349 RepID=A0AAP2GPH1_9BACT|nr:CHAT domain-containing protein [Chryseosolibacter histidini]MBT1699113.1 CHAT domain-containing protein [Chryseosolibacter histidini]
MKKVSFLTLSVLLCLFASQAAYCQNKKLDKALQKIDNYYNSGRLEKALSSLGKFKKGALKAGANSNYMVVYYLQDARINLAMGIIEGFETSLTNALATSLNVYGENSTSYATTMLDVADIYLDYGNFRISREYIEKAEAVLKKTDQLNDAMKGRIALAKAEAMIGQGFANTALDLLREYEKYFAARAVEKETIVEGNEIKTKRIPEGELFQRFNDYAKLKTLIGSAIAKKGRISIIGADAENPDVDAAFLELDSWLKGKRRFLGETSLADIEYRYVWAKAFKENGNKDLDDSRLEFDNMLSDLKKKTNPTNALAHEIYISYLELLMSKGINARYINTKLEYEKVIDKYYPKASLHRVNLKAVEFDTKMQRDQTRNLETNALNLISSKSLPKNYKTTIRIYEFLYEVALAEQRYTNAESYLNQLLEIKKDLCGENSPEYHLARVHLANFYLDYTNKMDEAGKIYEESFFRIVVKEIDKNHKDMITILNHIAQWYEFTDKYNLAAKTLKDAREATIQKFKNDDILLGMELNNIAKLQLKLGEYDEAEANILKALEIIDLKENREYAEWRPSYISALESQAKLYGLKGLFDEAESNLERTRKLIQKADGPMGDELSTAKELSSLLIQLGRYSATDKLLNNLIEEYERLFGKSTLRLIDPLVDKGRILLAKGDYTEAEKTALRAYQIANSIYGDNSTKTAPTQKLLGDIYYTLGDYEKAEANVTKAMASQEKQFGRKHIEVAKSLSQLALIKFYKGDNAQQVEKLMIESRDVMAEKLGKDNPQYAEILKNVAVLYISERRFDIAFNSLTVAESIWKAKAGRKNNINTASIYTLTGDVYYQQKNYKRAEEFYIKAKNLYESFFSTTHPEYVKVLSKLSKVYYMEQDFKRSKKNIEDALGNYENFIKQFFPALSEREKAKYWNTIKGDFEFYNTLAFSNLDDFKDLTKKVYDYQLLTKALLLSSSIKIRERIMNSTDEPLKAQYNTWIQKKELLTLALSMSATQLTENEIDPNQLHQEVERLEKELSQRSEIFGESFENKRITFDDVRKSLKPNEAAIEMVRYRYFNHSLTDSVIYAALYVKPELTKPKAIILKDGHRMETRFFKFYRNAITGKLEDNISYGVFWQPIIEEIGQVATIYLSADGIYNQINLEAIATPDGRFVIDNSNIVLVSNTKDIFLRKAKTRAATDNTAMMFGNPTFYLTASADNKNIASLPGTEKEINQLQFMLKQKGWNTSEYVERSAAEEKVKELNSPKIFHIATHGLYRPSTNLTLEKEIEGNEALLAQNPLMRTGLLLRGAGDLLDKTDYNYNMENGILTAYEAMSLNLDKTDLVVLSACETGLGDLEAGEGVYGLQRAFLVAGAKVLIMSMFKVDDDATQKLMLKFYQKWLNSNNLRQSFIDAKKELRVEYPEPIYWGAFMMIGID